MPFKSAIAIAFLFTLHMRLIAQIFLPVVPTQMDFRWRNDNGSETGASWKAANDQPVTLSNYNNVRLRFGIHGMCGSPDPQMFPCLGVQRTMKLQYSRNGSIWTDITTSSQNHFQLALSAYFSDGDPVTEQITGTWIGGGRMTESAESFNWTFPYEEYEFEYCFIPTQHMLNGLYYFRISNMDSYYVIAQATLSVTEITLTDGSGLTPDATLGETNQVIGCFQLISNASGPILEDVSILLNGPRTGLSNLKFWASSDETFNSGSDTQRGSTVSADPGDGNSVAFSSLSESMGTSTITFFLTADIASDATGTVQGFITGNSSLAISGGAFSATFNNVPLSDGDVALPVELLFFSAKPVTDGILLTWITESEINNVGYILERKSVKEDWQTIASYQTYPDLQGKGNTSSRTEYAFMDLNIQSGAPYCYRLSDVNTKGVITIIDILEATSNIQTPNETKLEPAVPNPFNPKTKITYKLAEEALVSINVYDINGRLVSRLLENKQQSPGSYSIHWLGKDDSERQVVSGPYILRLDAGEIVQTLKILLVR
ncbi:FlgD immunoglobulin-like domain containing protein [bacterium]